MSRIKTHWHRKFKSNARIIMDIRTKSYRKSLTRLEQIIRQYNKMETMISICLVENSKQRESYEKTIENIRKYLSEYSPDHGML